MMDALSVAPLSFFVAAAQGKTQIVQDALQQHPHWGRSKGPSQCTALRLAAVSAPPETLEALLPYSDPDAVDKDGQTPFVMAVRAKNVKAIPVLLPHSNPQTHGRGSPSALGWAVFHNNVDLLRQLVARVSVNHLLEYHDGQRPLEVAKHRGYWACADLLASRLPAEHARQLFEWVEQRGLKVDLPLSRAWVERDAIEQSLSASPPQKGADDCACQNQDTMECLKNVGKDKKEDPPIESGRRSDNPVPIQAAEVRPSIVCVRKKRL